MKLSPKNIGGCPLEWPSKKEAKQNMLTDKMEKNEMTQLHIVTRLPVINFELITQ